MYLNGHWRMVRIKGINNSKIQNHHWDSSWSLDVIFNNSLNWHSILFRSIFVCYSWKPTLLYGCKILSRNRLKITYNNIASYIYGRTRDSRISECSCKIYNVSFENLLKCRSLIYLHKVIYVKQPHYLYRRLIF